MYTGNVQLLEVSDESPQEGGKRILLDSGGSERDVNGRPYSEWALVNEGNGRPKRVCLGLRRLHDPRYGGVTPMPMGKRHCPIPAYSLAEQVEKQVRTLTPLRATPFMTASITSPMPVSRVVGIECFSSTVTSTSSTRTTCWSCLQRRSKCRLGFRLHWMCRVSTS